MVTPPRMSRSPERSEGEGSDSPGTEILRCAQDDMRRWTVSVALDMKFAYGGDPYGRPVMGASLAPAGSITRKDGEIQKRG